MAKRVLILCFLLLLTGVVIQADPVQYRLDSNGKKIFYNIPVKSETAAVYYSRKAEDYWSLIGDVCRGHGVDPELVKAVIQVESNYNPFAISPKGARGLMQLMPGTATRYGVQQIFDPRENIEGGVKYLRDLIELFDSNLRFAVAAYNAGENTVQRVNGIPNYVETQNYVRKVMALYNGESSYRQYAKSAPRNVVYYKYVDDKGVTHYSATPVPGVQVTKVSFYY